MKKILLTIGFCTAATMFASDPTDTALNVNKDQTKERRIRKGEKQHEARQRITNGYDNDDDERRSPISPSAENAFLRKTIRK